MLQEAYACAKASVPRVLPPRCVQVSGIHGRASGFLVARFA